MKLYVFEVKIMKLYFVCTFFSVGVWMDVIVLDQPLYMSPRPVKVLMIIIEWLKSY